MFVFIGNHANKYGFNSSLVFSPDYYGGDIVASDLCHTGQEYNKFGSYINQKCFLGDAENNKTSALIFGDSHAMSYQGMISVWLNQKKIKGYIFTKSLTANPRYFRYIMYNSHFSQNIVYYLKAFHPKVVILAGNWDYYAANIPNAINNVEKSISAIVKNNSIPMVFLDMPSLNGMKPYCGVKSRGSSILLDYIGFERKKRCQIKINSDEGYQLFAKMKRKYPELIIINPSQSLCSDNLCPSVYSNKNLYFDDGHLSYFGSKFIGNRYLNKFGNPLP